MAHNDSNCASYDGDTMAGSSCEGEQLTRGANERRVAEILRISCTLGQELSGELL